jgi:hypothetical protein
MVVNVVEMDDIGMIFSDSLPHGAPRFTVPQERDGFARVLNQPLAPRVVVARDEQVLVRRRQILRETGRQHVHLVAARRLPRHEIMQIGLGAAAQIEEFVDVEDAHIQFRMVSRVR